MRKGIYTYYKERLIEIGGNIRQRPLHRFQGKIRERAFLRLANPPNLPYQLRREENSPYGVVAYLMHKNTSTNYFTIVR